MQAAKTASSEKCRLSTLGLGRDNSDLNRADVVVEESHQESIEETEDEVFGCAGVPVRGPRLQVEKCEFMLSLGLIPLSTKRLMKTPEPFEPKQRRSQRLQQQELIETRRKKRLKELCEDLFSSSDERMGTTPNRSRMT